MTPRGREAARVIGGLLLDYLLCVSVPFKLLIGGFAVAMKTAIRTADEARGRRE